MIHSLDGRTPRIATSAFVAGSADVIGAVEIGENSSVWFNAVLRGDIEGIRIGANSNIQDGCIVHTNIGIPTIVGDWVSVGHRAVLHACTIGDHCLIGMGAVVLNNVRIGEGAIVAAGAVVLDDTVIPPRSLFMGVPAKFRRQLDEKDRAFIDLHAMHYLQHRERYLAELKKQAPRP